MLSDRIASAVETFARDEETQLRFLMEHFTKSELCNWVHQYFNRHKQYITGIKFKLTNVCYSKIIEGTLYMHVERACYDRECIVLSLATRRKEHPFVQGPSKFRQSMSKPRTKRSLIRSRIDSGRGAAISKLLGLMAGNPEATVRRLRSH